MTGHWKDRGYLEVRRVDDEEQANQLLSQGWDLFTVVAGEGDQIHYILTRVKG